MDKELEEEKSLSRQGVERWRVVVCACSQVQRLEDDLEQSRFALRLEISMQRHVVLAIKHRSRPDRDLSCSRREIPATDQSQSPAVRSSRNDLVQHRDPWC